MKSPARFLPFLLLACFSTAAPAPAAPIELVIERPTQNFDVDAKPIPLSLSGFSGEVEAVLRFDLFVQGFSFVGPEQAQYLVKGANGARVEGQLYDAISKQALFDAITMPNAAISFGYESWLIETKKGDVVTGVIAEETPALVTVRIDETREVRLRPADIASRTRSALSIMPEGPTSVRNPSRPRLMPISGASPSECTTACAAFSSVPSPPKAITASASRAIDARVTVGQRPLSPAAAALSCSIDGAAPCAWSHTAAASSACSASGTVRAINDTRTGGMVNGGSLRQRATAA